MLLYDYLNKMIHNRRILIVSDIARGRDIIRLHEARTGQPVCNVICMTIPQMADIIYRYILSEKGFDEEFEILDDTQSKILFNNVLNKNIKNLCYFNNEKMMNLATVAEIFNKVNLIRTNGLTDEEPKVKNDRITDLRLLADEYQNTLATEKLMDRIAKELFVLDALQRVEDVKHTLEDVFSAEISYLKEDVLTLNGLHSKLLYLMVNTNEPEIHTFSHNADIKLLDNCKGKTYFSKGYGSFNEAASVANDIFEKKRHFGSVTVLYQSDDQLKAISSALRGNNIPMRIVSGYPAAENPYISLAKRILSWAEDDYSEKALERILASSVIKVKGDSDDVNVLAGQKYFDYIADAGNRWEDGFVLGWGYERNIEFVRHEKALTTDHSVTEILNMHEALLDIFGEKGIPFDETNKVCPVKIYEKLVTFTEGYTFKGTEYAVVANDLKSLKNAIALEERKLTLNESIDLIRNLLDGIYISDDPDETAVTVRSARDKCILDRPYVYVTGLSLKDMQRNRTESPVLSDHEMELFIENGYLPTLKNEADKREKDMLYTLASFDGEEIVFSYSDYDTVGFCENNPSSFFRRLLSEFGESETECLSEFVYGNPENSVSTEAGTTSKNDEICCPVLSSSSSVEVLLNCPKQYAYKRVMNIPEQEFTLCDNSRWLDARCKGMFFHSIVEKYCNARLILPVKEKYETKVDTVLVEKIAQEVKKELLDVLPAPFAQLADSETKDMADECCRYIQNLLDELNRKPFWRVLSAEKRFTNCRYPVKTFDGKDHEFNLSGFIDRIDYRTDKALKKCYIRITDYKTGKRDKKDKDIKQGKLIQYDIYKKAVMESGMAVDEKGEEIHFPQLIRQMVAELECDDSVKDYSFEFENFQYVFPMEKTAEEPISLCEDELEDTNLTRLKAILTITENYQIYPDQKELVEITENLGDRYSDHKDDINDLCEILKDSFKNAVEKCDHCPYECLCINRKAGDI